MIYFFDNNISPRLVKMLAALDVDSRALRDMYHEGIKDVPLLTELAGKDYIFVTNDMAQFTRAAEAMALKTYQITGLFLGPYWSKMKLWGQAAWLITRWQKIEQIAQNLDRGSCVEITQQGKARTFSL